jgi:hypothetical protein
MWLNVLAALIALLIILSPYIGTSQHLNAVLDLRYIANIKGWYKPVVMGLGSLTLLYALYNIYLRKIRGILYIMTGLILVATSYFYNEESFAILPVKNTMLGGGIFFVFVASIVLVLIGVVQEFLLSSD